MANDTDWVEDVKRWCRTGRQAASDGALPAVDQGDEVGYEAAHPALQARHWPDAEGLTTDR